MVYKINGNYKHILTKNDKLNIQNHFCFVDTETKTTKIDNETEKLTFYFGYSYFWKRKEKQLIPFPFYKISLFWNMLDKQFNNENKELYFFAHNTEFDFKILNGYIELYKRNWILQSFYIRNNVYILIYKKKDYTLYIYDTMNYVKKPLKILGKNLGIKKLDIDFNDCTEKELIKYCKRDTRIIYKFIKQLLDFLESYNLTKLKGTAGSLSFNCFRHKFYKPIKQNDKKRISCSLNNIVIHNWKRVIKLERDSYHGGITDCFNLNSNLDCYKLDINSMYPSIMKNNRFPIRLIKYWNNAHHRKEKLLWIWNFWKNWKLYTTIQKVSVLIPKDNAYILNDFGLGKNTFGYSEKEPITLTLCEPELRFIENNGGKILEVHEIALYRVKRIFNKFINFFYSKRKYYKQIHNDTFIEFTKIFMNTLYGKFAQKQIVYDILKFDNEFVKENGCIIEKMIEQRKQELQNDDYLYSLCYLGTLNETYELYIINNQLYRVRKTEYNAKDSFVAISSLITSYSRMLLIKYLKIAERKNTYYCDTDSLFTNEKGYENLKQANLINEYDLGKLKIEGIGKVSIYAPKFYDFNDKRKAKGIKKDSILINETDKKAIYQTTLWKKFKSDLKKGFINHQIIITTTKEINKKYDKGKIINNIVYPYSIQEINQLSM